MAEQFQEMLAMMEEKFTANFQLQSAPQTVQSSQNAKAATANNPEIVGQQIEKHIQTQALKNRPDIQQSQKQESFFDKSSYLQETSQKEQSYQQAESQSPLVKITQVMDFTYSAQVNLTQEPYNISNEHALVSKSLFDDRQFRTDNIEQALSDEQETKDYYKSLSDKLQKALNKISTEKQLSAPFHQRNAFFDRIEQFQKKKDFQIESMRKEKEEKINYQVKGKPMINSYSQKIIVNHEPIYTRYQKVLEKKNSKIEQRLAQKKRKQEDEDNNFQAQCSQIARLAAKRVGSPRSNQAFYFDMQLWNEKKNKQIADKALLYQEQQFSKASFRPEINLKSKQLMKKNGSRIPIYERQIKAKKVSQDQQCTFKPKINHLRKVIG